MTGTLGPFLGLCPLSTARNISPTSLPEHAASVPVQYGDQFGFKIIIIILWKSTCAKLYSQIRYC